MRALLRHTLWRGLAAAVGALTVAVAVTTAARAWSELTYKPMKVSDIRSGREWQVILVTSSFCGASKRSDVQSAVRHIIPIVQGQALANGDQFSSLGVSIDWDVERGVSFLNDIATFHEVNVGRNWVNQAVTRYMGAPTDSPTTPTVLIVTRTIEAASGRGITVGKDSVVRRLVGAKAIIEFDNWLLTRVDPSLVTSK